MILYHQIKNGNSILIQLVEVKQLVMK